MLQMNKTVLTLVLVADMALSGFLAYYFLSQKTNTQFGAESKTELPTPTDAIQELKTVKGKTHNVLLLGYGGAGHDGGYLSDVIIVVNIDREYKEATFIEPAEFDKGRRKSSAVLLDVRMPQEFEQGHIEGAVNLNFFDPNFKNQLLELDKDKKYYVYCKNDSRSERAAEFLLQNDYPEVYVLKGGYMAWKEAGLQ